MYLPYIRQYFLQGKYTVRTHKYCTVKGSVTDIYWLVCTSKFLLVYIQNYLRVALQDASNGCTAKTLQVHPYATTEDVCQICADKFKVSDPENYALFLLTDETTQQLAPDTHPQRIKAELHSRPQPQLFFFVYRQIQDLTVPSEQLDENTLSS